MNWAIVIGVDHYPASEDWTLHGAVRDALGMREWLLSRDGGNVDPQNMFLLLSPIPSASQPNVQFTPASRDNIVATINALLKKSEKKGDRLFFHFSGHGLSVNLDLSDKQGILASDFSLEDSTRSLTVKSVFELFQSTHFKEQFFTIDACRNIPVSRKRLGEFPHIEERVIPTPPQFVMFATQPNVEAKEIGLPGNESGAFTSALLKGLKGEGDAKAWDFDSGEYVVRWNELFSAVLEDVKSRKLRIDAEGGGPLVQEPRQYGERGDQNPELGRFRDASVPDVNLSLDLEPNPDVLPLASITITELGGVATQVPPPISRLPIVAPLRPKTYGVSAWADGYKPVRKSIRLYKATSVKLEFQKGQPAFPQTGSLGMIRPDMPFPTGTFGYQEQASESPAMPHSMQEGGIPTAQSSGVTQLGGLEVRSQDSLALLQITNEVGTVVASGRGTVARSDLPLGFYSIQMISPEGTVVSELTESLVSATARSIWLSAPTVKSPSMKTLVELAGFQEAGDGSLSPSETIGPAFFLKSSTVLALAAAAQLESDKSYGYRLRQVPLASFHEIVGPHVSAGIHLIFGDEHSASFWRAAEAYDLIHGEARQLRYGGGDSGILKSLAIDCTPGRRILRINWHDQQAKLHCHVLPNRVTLLVVTREFDGTIQIHQYMPLSGFGDSSTLQYSTWNGRDPYFQGSAFAAIRRIEYMQRSFMQGRVSPLKPDIELLLYDKWVDPIAGCLGSYLALRMNMIDGLDIATANLVRYFGELPDAHLLRATFLLRVGNQAEAQHEFQQSLDRGVPVFNEGVILLADLARFLALEQSVKDRLERRAVGLTRGQLWSMDIEVM